MSAAKKQIQKQPRHIMHKFNYSFPVLAAVALLAFTGAGCTAKMKASYHLKRAEKFYDAGEMSSAAIEYKNVLRNTPQNAEAWSRLGLIFINEGRAPEAFPVLARAEQLDPNNLDVRLKLGEIYLAMGKFKEARDEADFVLARRPQDEQAPMLLADTVTNDFSVYSSQLQKLQQKGDSAPVEVALGALAIRKNDLKTAEADFNRAITLNPKFSAAYTALGGLYVAQRDLKRADAAFQKAAELGPVWNGDGVRYAQFKILSGDISGGQKLLQDITKKTPDFLPAWMALAQLAAAQNNYTNALTLLGNVLNRDPENFDALLLQGHLQLLAGQTTQAIDSLEQMSKLYPQASPVRYALAQAYLVNNQTNEANASLVKALSLNPKDTQATLLLAETQIRGGNAAAAIVSLRDLLQQQPQVVQGWLLLAEAYMAQSSMNSASLNSAIQIYRQLEVSYPKSPQVPLLLGIALVQQKQNDAARAQFEKALQIQPDYLPAVEQLVNLDLMEKQYASALQRVQQMAVKNPNQAVLQLLLGKTFAAQGETNQAELALSKAIKLQPDSQAAYLLLAQLYITAGQNQKALENLQTALAKEPKDVVAWMLMGNVYDLEKDYEHSRDAYEKLLAVAPGNAIALNNLACVYADHLNQLDKAYPLARQSHDAAPSDPSIDDTLGWILYRRGQYPAALDLLQQSAAKLNTVPVVEFHLGMICYMMDNETDARAAFQRALELPGNFSEKTECQQRLSILNLDVNKSPTDGRTFLEKWTASHPDDPVALAKLASIYQSSGMSGKAIAVYESILKANSQNVMALANLARLYAATDRAKAYSFAKSAYQLSPTDPEIAHLTGRLAFLAGDYSRALTLLQLAAQSQSRNPEALFDMGEAFYSMGKVAEAKAAMQNALQIQPAFTDANNAKRFLQMVALADSPVQAAVAKSQIDEILKTTPDYVPALMVKATIAGQEPDLSAAEKTYENILTIYPDFAPAQKQLAILYSKNPANDARAYPLAVKARVAFPNDASVAEALGIITYRQGDYSRADDLLQESVRQISGDPELLYYLGLTQYHLKQTAESKTTLQRALALNLFATEAADAKRVLAEMK
jgi:tetratricopeptide (TPR) repeat protein